MKMAPLLRILGLLVLALGAWSAWIAFSRSNIAYAIYALIAAIAGAVWFFTGAEALTYLQTLVENTRPKQDRASVAPALVPTAQELNDAVRAMKSARNP
jgi:hypothetical protein